MKPLMFLLMTLAFVTPLASAENARKPVGKETSAGQKETLIGVWHGEDGTTTFNADGSLISNGQKYFYTAKDGVITLIREDGAVTIPYQLSGGKLVVIMDGVATTLTRNPGAVNKNAGNGGKRPGEVSSELLLSSAWCSSTYNAKTGYSSSSRVRLNADGTYSAGSRNEGYSSGSAGTYASQSDSNGGGRWQVVNGQLYMSEGGGPLEPVQTRIERNNNGYVILVANGVEYAQCR